MSQNFIEECRKLIKDIENLEKYDYSGFQSALGGYIKLSQKASTPYSLDGQDNIKDCLESSENSTNQNERSKNWEKSKNLLIEHIEIWIEAQY